MERMSGSHVKRRALIRHRSRISMRSSRLIDASRQTSHADESLPDGRDETVQLSGGRVDGHDTRSEGWDEPGTGALSPLRMPWSGWKLIVRQTIFELGSSQCSLAAGGCAFFSTLSLFPALSTLISLYGLVFDVQSVEPQLEVMRRLLPYGAYTLIGTQIHSLVTQPHSSLTIGLIFSFAVALWSASAATKSVLMALNIAYDVTEKRGFFAFQFMALATTFSGALGAGLTLAVMVALPALVHILPMYFGFSHLPYPLDFFMDYGTSALIKWGSTVLVLFFVFMALTMLYRFGPCRPAVAWRWVMPGSILSTLLWVLSSKIFSFYVAHYGGYNATYGPLGTVAAMMMWMFVSAYVVLLGAELNAGIEDRVVGRKPKLSAEAVEVMGEQRRVAEEVLRNAAAPSATP